MLKSFFKIKLSFQQKVEVLLILAAILHIGLLIKGFINCDKMEIASGNQQSTPDAPDFTICSNVPEDLERQFEDFLNTNCDEKTAKLMAIQYDLYFPWIQNGFLAIDKITKKNELKLLDELAKMTVEERLNYAQFPLMRNLLYVHRQYMQRQSFMDRFTFNNLYYGNCIHNRRAPSAIDIFGDNENNDDDETSALELHLYIPNFRNGEYSQDDMAEKHYVMVIHEPNTEPIFEDKNIIKLWPQAQTRINVEKIQYSYDTDCVADRNQTDDKYLYSVDSCMASCLQKLTMKYCNCQLPQFSSDHQLPSCTGCSKIPQSQLDNCNCLPPCSYSRYNVKTEVIQTLENEMDEIKTRLSKTQTALNIHADIESLSFREHSYAETFLIEFFMKKIFNSAIVIRTFNSNTDSINVVSMCRFEVVLSQIGGILGTYTGLCIMMIVEIAFNYIRKVVIKRQPKPTVSLKYETTTAGKSSISLLVQIENSIPRLKLFWSVLLIIGLYNTLVQGYQLFSDYTQFSVKINSEIINEIQFPAVTICSNNILKPNPPQDVFDIVLRARNLSVVTNFDRRIRQSVLAKSLEAFSYLPYSKRLEVGLSLKSYINDCHYKLNSQQYESCLSHFHEFSFGKYGNCASFNPGLLNDKDSIDFKPSEVKMKLQFKPGLVADLVEQIGLMVFIHPKSTSPNTVDLLDGIFIKPGFNYSLEFSTIIKEHLPAPYPSKCVSPTSPEQQWKNNFHNHSNAFEYTQKECQSSIVFNKSLSDESQTLSFMYQGRLSMEIIAREKLADSREKKVKQKCPTSCRDVIHQIEAFNVATKIDGSEEDENKTLDEILVISHQNPICDYNEIVIPYAPSWLTISPYKLETKVTKEEPVIDVENILYQLGGTMGLWVL
ncbi:hypothetical protein CHUAL_002766 [Chamberlinius hualienensis]